MGAHCPPSRDLPALDKYDGTGDPRDHIEHVRAEFALRPQPDAIKCRSLATTFTGAARRWFRQLPNRSIRSFDQLGEELAKRFVGSQAIVRPRSHLLSIKQGAQESLRDYLARFQQGCACVDRPEPDFQLAAVMSGLRYNTPLWKEMKKEGAQDWDTFTTIATKFINLEDAVRLGAASRAHHPSEDRSQDLNRKRSSGVNPGQSSSDASKKFRPISRYDKYTPLTVPIEEVYMATAGESFYSKPRPLRDPPKSSKKFCFFHNEPGHTTADCYALKDEIESLIQRGYLREYTVKSGGKKKKNRGPNPRAGDGNQQEETQHQEPTDTVNVISGGPGLGGNSRRAMKSYAEEAKFPPRAAQVNSVAEESPSKKRKEGAISFSDEEAKRVHHPHNDPLVISAVVGNRTVRRAMVDTGSSVNILYREALQAMGLGDTRLEPAAFPLYGFAGESLTPDGLISLPVTLGTKPLRATTMMDFVVVNRQSPFNILFGRPFLYGFRAVASIHHLCLKFPADGGIGIELGDQAAARSCYVMATESNPRPT